MRFLVFPLLAGLAGGCGNASPAASSTSGGGGSSPDGGAPDGGPTDGGTPDSGGGDAGDPHADAGDGDDAGSSCLETPGEIACRDAGPCPTATQFCCGDVSVGPSACLASGAACLQGDIVAATCDDTSDCPANQICCSAPADVQFGAMRTVCQAPLAGPAPPCGADGPSIPYDHLCSCDAECGGGGSCSLQNAAWVHGRKACPSGG